MCSPVRACSCARSCHPASRAAGSFQHGIHLGASVGDNLAGLRQHLLLLGRHLALNDLLHAVLAQHAGHAHEQSLNAVLPLQKHAAGKDLLLVVDDGLGHLQRGPRRAHEGAAAAQQPHHLRPGLAGARLDLVQDFLREELLHGHPRNAARRADRHHVISVPAQHKRLDILHGHPRGLRHEQPVPSAVQHPGHAHQLVLRGLHLLVHGVHNRIQGVGNVDHEGVGGVLRDPLRDLLGDRQVDGQQLLAGRDLPVGALFARHPSRVDHQVAALQHLVALRAHHHRVALRHRVALGDVQHLPLRQVRVRNVHQAHRLCQVALGALLGQHPTDVATTHNPNLPQHQPGSGSAEGHCVSWKKRAQQKRAAKK
eukprot:RCo017773